MADKLCSAMFARESVVNRWSKTGKTGMLDGMMMIFNRVLDLVVPSNYGNVPRKLVEESAEEEKKRNA